MKAFFLNLTTIIAVIALCSCASVAEAWIFGNGPDFRVRHVDVFPGHSVRFTIEKDETASNGTAVIVACTSGAGNRIDLDPRVWEFTSDEETLGVSKRGSAFPSAPLIVIAIIVKSEDSSYTAFELWEVHPQKRNSKQVRAARADQALNIFKVCGEALEALNLGRS